MSLKEDLDRLSKIPLKPLKIDYRQDTKDAINEEIEAIARMVENEEEFKVEFYEYEPGKDAVSIWGTLRNIAAAIRARKRGDFRK